MKLRAAMVLLIMLGGGAGVAHAQAATDCKICRDQHRACVQAHSQAACKNELDICMKHCGRK